MYRRLFTSWDEFADAQVVFDDHGSDNHFCAQKVWEALLAAFPLTHARMQTQIFVRELSRLMTWDGHTADDVNSHFHTSKMNLQGLLLYGCSHHRRGSRP